MSRPVNNKYPFLVWVTSLALAPVIFIIVTWLYTGEKFITENFYFIWAMILYSLLFSIPTFLVYYFAFKYLSQKNNSLLILKIILNSIASLGMTITIYFLAEDSGVLIIIYAITIFVTGFSFRLR